MLIIDLRGLETDYNQNESRIVWDWGVTRVFDEFPCIY